MPRRRDEARAPLTNGDLARIFHEIGDILEVKGELVFKTVAYHRAADAIAHSPVRRRRGLPRRRPAARSRASARRSATRSPSSSTTGRMAFYERLRAEVPPTPRRAAPDPGRRAADRPARSTRRSASKTSRSLQARRRGGPAPELKGSPASTEQRILEGIAKLESQPRRLLLDRAQALSTTSSPSSRTSPASLRIVQAGLVPAPPRDHRRPRPARRDRRPDGASSSGSSSLGVVDAVIGAGRRQGGRHGCCAGRRST